MSLRHGMGIPQRLLERLRCPRHLPRALVVLIHIVLSTALVGLHATDQLRPSWSDVWTNAEQHDGGHDHRLCVLFWGASPVLEAPPEGPRPEAGVPSMPSLAPAPAPYSSPRVRPVLPRAPPLRLF